MLAEAARRRIVDALQHARRPRLRVPLGPSDCIPLAEAATALRLAQRGSDLDRISRGLSESDESLLAFWAHCVVKSGIPVYGCRIMATQPEIIADTEMESGKLVNHASRLDPGHGHPVQDVCALQVSRGNLDAYLARIGVKAA